MTTTGARQHTIASYVASPALAPGTRAALERLGYRLLPAVVRGHWDDASWSADVRLVDERHVARVPRDATPVVVLAGDPARHWDNERIVGMVGRPAALGELYPLLQQALEDHPRRAARLTTSVRARGGISDRRFDAEIRTLSERGARIETGHALAPDTRINLGFPLPCEGLISLRARVCSWDAPSATVEFVDVPAAARSAIAEFVQRGLATA